MTRAEKFIPIILKNEGYSAYTNDSSDSGGETKYGISDTADGKRDGMTDTNFDGKPDKRIKDLTLQDAIKIYKKKYYDPVKADLIENELLALHVFDMGVNAGTGTAIRLLQQTIGVKIDGVFGEKTLAKVNSGDYSIKFINARLAHYTKIATGKNAKYLKGWINRVTNTSKAL